MNHDEIIRQIKELEMGIIPFSVWFKASSPGVSDKRWSNIPEAEKKIAKRKFRKIFRKACRCFGLDQNSNWSTAAKVHLVNRFISEACRGRNDEDGESII